MGLNDIQLSPATLNELFKKSLVETGTAKSPDVASPPGFNILGKNLKQVILLVDNPDVAFVPDEELNFLLGILSACKLNMNDVGILNIHKYPSADYNSISAALQASVIILFGVTTAAIQLPLSFPYYQVQRYNNQTYLSSPALADIHDNKEEKTKLWASLRQLFSI